MKKKSPISYFPSEIVMRFVDDLIPYARNARTHSPKQIAQIASSIKEFGFTNPVLTDGEDGIIAGHGRVLASQKLGLSEVPCIELSHLSEAQKRAYIIADNKLAEKAEWDMELLKFELGELKIEGFDLSLTGFDVSEFNSLFDIGAGLGVGGDAAQRPIPENWLVIVECIDEAEQVELIKQLQAEGRKVKGSIG